MITINAFLFFASIAAAFLVGARFWHNTDINSDPAIVAEWRRLHEWANKLEAQQQRTDGMCRTQADCARQDHKIHALQVQVMDLGQEIVEQLAILHGDSALVVDTLKDNEDVA